MKNFTIRDANPSVAKSLGQMTKEINDLVVVITTAGGPFIQESDWQSSEGSEMRLEKSENGYDVSAISKTDGTTLKRFMVTLKEGRLQLLKIEYSILPEKSIVIPVSLNCEGEDLIEAELIRAFKRDFSHESHVLMKKDLDEVREEERAEMKEALGQKLDDAIDKAKKAELLEEFKEQKGEELSENHEKPEISEPESSYEDNTLEVTDEVSKELNELSQKVLSSIEEVNEIIDRLNMICYDISRGGTPTFSEEKIGEEILENGAKVQMIDQENQEYKITFRKGSLNNLSEVSFFLEKEGGLVFSVYLSSQGTGKITVGENQPKILLNRIERDLNG